MKNHLSYIFKGTALLFCLSCFSLRGMSQENQIKSQRHIPLHVEACVGFGTESKNLMPFNANIDLNYHFTRRFSIHATMQNDFFLPKESVTKDFNQATNLGGGVAYILLPERIAGAEMFEIRAFVTATVNSSYLKNTSYNIGLYWYRDHKDHRIEPFVGAGYSAKDFRSDALGTYHGAYLALGFRF